MNPYRLKCWCIVDKHGNIIDRLPEEADEKTPRPAIFQEERWARRQLPNYPGGTLVACEAVIEAVADTPAFSISVLPIQTT